MRRVVTVSLDELYRIKNELIRLHVTLTEKADENIAKYGRCAFVISQDLGYLITSGNPTPPVASLTCHDWLNLYASVTESSLHPDQKTKLKDAIRTMILKEGND